MHRLSYAMYDELYSDAVRDIFIICWYIFIKFYLAISSRSPSLNVAWSSLVWLRGETEVSVRTIQREPYYNEIGTPRPTSVLNSCQRHLTITKSRTLLSLWLFLDLSDWYGIIGKDKRSISFRSIPVPSNIVAELFVNAVVPNFVIRTMRSGLPAPVSELPVNNQFSIT